MAEPARPIAAGPIEADRDPDARAAATEAQMTDDERFRLLHGVMPIPLAASPNTYPVAPTAGFIAGVPRLGIPDIVETDAGLGVTNPMQARPGDVATAMSSGQLLAATFDPDLAFRGGQVMGSEARAKGYTVLLAGGVNLARDPRGGRNFEYLGEDPLLAGVIGGATIRGIGSAGVVSTVKHFALNAQETLRSTLDARVAEGAFRESDLLAFQIAIERGQPGAVMCAYNQVNGAYACGNDFLLTTVLRHDWGYRGWVMSDWGATHGLSYFAQGLDQESGSQFDGTTWFDAPLKAEFAAGRVSRAQVGTAVRRILRSLYAVGADRPRAPLPIDYLADARVARATAAAGIVLLQNDGILPLAAGARRILVVGGHADIGVLAGGGSSQVTPSNGTATILPVSSGRFGLALYAPSSPLKALRAALPAADIQFDSGYHPEVAAARAAAADLVVVFATQWSTEGEDAGSLVLPEGQDGLIAQVAAANRNTVVVLETGNPVQMPWQNTVRAIVEAWYPGQEGGGAIADVLSGTVNPSGHLPQTFPADMMQTPRTELPGLGLPAKSSLTIDYAEGADVGYRWFAARKLTPLYAFGHGLSYTRFELSAPVLRAGATPQARVTVRNTGDRAGAVVPQLYLVAAAGHRLQRLAGFTKVLLAPGERRMVSIAIDPRLVADWRDDGWTIASGRYAFAVGRSAADLGAEVELKLKARHWR